MNYNDQFFACYQQLEFAIGRKLPKKVDSPIIVYMNTLSSDRAGQLDQMRLFRNKFKIHCVGTNPTVPYEWITFLKREIQCVDNGGAEMERRLVQSMNRLNARKSVTRTNANHGQAARGSQHISSGASIRQPNRQLNHQPNHQPARQNGSVSLPTGQINQSHRYCDKEHNFSIDLQIKKGQGRITKKAPFSSERKQLVDFSIYLDYSGKLTDYNAELLTRTGPKAIKLRRGENKMQVPASEISANTVKVKLSFEYKVGMFTTKKDAMTVGRNV